MLFTWIRLDWVGLGWIFAILLGFLRISGAFHPLERAIGLIQSDSVGLIS
jgi:hypothetical protein